MTGKGITPKRLGENMIVKYKGGSYGVVKVNFDENLVALDTGCSDMWVRIENIEISPPKKSGGEK